MEGKNFDEYERTEGFEKGDNESPEEVEQIEEKQEGFSFDRLGELLRTPTGEGDLIEYIEHPLNFNESTATAKIIRGLTGFFGTLKLAFIDIAMGLYESFEEMKKIKKGE